MRQDKLAAGHAWVYAPPFSIVDITLRQQPYTGTKKQYIPEIVLIKKGMKAVSTVEDIISPEVRILMQSQRIPKSLMLDYGASELKLIQKTFPAQLIEFSETKIKYSPVAAHASIESLPDMSNMEFDGKSPYEMYKQEIEGKVGSIA